MLRVEAFLRTYLRNDARLAWRDSSVEAEKTKGEKTGVFINDDDEIVDGGDVYCSRIACAFEPPSPKLDRR